MLSGYILDVLTCHNDDDDDDDFSLKCNDDDKHSSK